MKLTISVQFKFLYIQININWDCDNDNNIKMKRFLCTYSVCVGEHPDEGGNYVSMET